MFTNEKTQEKKGKKENKTKQNKDRFSVFFVNTWE